MPATLRRPIGCAVVALLASACGTTVAGVTTAPAGTGTNDQLTAPSGTAAGAGGAGGFGTAAPVPGAPGSVGAVPGASGSIGGAGAAGPGSVPAPPGTTSGPSGQTMAPGVSASKIYVGILTTKNQDAVNNAAGAAGISLGDTHADAQAIVDDINKHGGIAGRKVVPVYYAVDSNSAQTQDSQLAAACERFSHDQRVFAAVGSGRASYRACLAKAGIVTIDEDLPSISDAEFARYPGLVELGYPRLSRIAMATLNSLAGQHYFSPWNTRTGGPAPAGKAKVGVLTLDDPGYNAVVDNVLIPGLKRLGYDPGSDVERVAVPDNAAGITGQAAANQSAELKFASDGVTHVVVFESNGGNSLLFMNQAESQHYRPRYGVNSASGLETLLAAGDIPTQQAVGAVGFGWIPAYDLPDNMNPDNGKYSNAERRHCVAAFKQHGITFDNANAEFAGFVYCASLDLLRVVLDRTPNVLTPAAFVQTLNGLGTAYQAPSALGTMLDATHHDGPSTGYYWRWFSDCKCLHYAGSPRRIPG